MNPLKEMKKFRKLVPLLVVLAGSAAMAASPVLGVSQERYLHVRVSDTGSHELVRVNVPLSLAEKVIPAINHGQLRDGKVQVAGLPVNDVNVKAILEALKTAPEGEFVTVQEKDSDVRVAKERGQMVVHVSDKKGAEHVDVTIPWEVAQALTSDTNENELNVEAAVKALENAGDVTLVTVTDHNQTVRVWVDSRNAGE